MEGKFAESESNNLLDHLNENQKQIVEKYNINLNELI